MANYIVYEGNGNSVRNEFETNTEIMVGDTIEFVSNNQFGYTKHRVVFKDGVKILKLVEDYDDCYGEQ